MSKKRKHKNRHIPHTNLNSNQGAQSMSPNPIQPMSSTLPPCHSATSPLPSSALICDQIVRAVQRQLAAKTANLNAADEELPQILDNYAMSMHMATLERIFAILEKFPAGSEGQPEHIKVIRMMLQALSAYQRAMSRRGREQAARRREQNQQAKVQTKQAKEQGQAPEFQTAKARAQATLQRFQDPLQAGTAGAVETESKDATAPRENQNPMPAVPPSSSALSTQNSALLPKDATQNQNLIAAAMVAS